MVGVSTSFRRKPESTGLPGLAVRTIFVRERHRGVGSCFRRNNGWRLARLFVLPGKAEIHSISLRVHPFLRRLFRPAQRREYLVSEGRQFPGRKIVGLVGHQV